MQVKYNTILKEWTIQITMDEIIILANSASALQKLIDNIKTLFGKK